MMNNEEYAFFLAYGVPNDEELHLQEMLHEYVLSLNM